VQHIECHSTLHRASSSLAAVIKQSDAVGGETALADFRQVYAI
jgi:hypothetical protein